MSATVCEQTAEQKPWCWVEGMWSGHVNFKCNFPKHVSRTTSHLLEKATENGEAKLPIFGSHRDWLWTLIITSVFLINHVEFKSLHLNWILLMKINSVDFFANHIALPWTRTINLTVKWSLKMTCRLKIRESSCDISFGIDTFRPKSCTCRSAFRKWLKDGSSNVQDRQRTT